MYNFRSILDRIQKTSPELVSLIIMISYKKYSQVLNKFMLPTISYNASHIISKHQLMSNVCQKPTSVIQGYLTKSIHFSNNYVACTYVGHVCVGRGGDRVVSVCKYRTLSNMFILIQIYFTNDISTKKILLQVRRARHYHLRDIKKTDCNQASDPRRKRKCKHKKTSRRKKKMTFELYPNNTLPKA